MLYYLDAGTGSMLVQLVVAGAAGAAVIGRIGWAKLTAPFRRRQTDTLVEHETQPSSPDDE